MSTSSKDFKVKNGLVVGGGGSFTDPVSVGTPTSGQHAATKDYVDSNSASLTISDSPPENPNPGDQWYNSGDGVTYVYYDGFWVESSSGGQETSLVGYATEAYVDSAISNVIDSAPTALDTLNELAAALNDDSSFATTVTNAIAAKADPVSSTAVSSNITLSTGKYFVDTSTTRTLTLPASPSLGDEIQVFDASGTAGTNNITVLNNGKNINGILDSALLDVNGVAAVFVYTGSTYGWRMA